MSNKRNKLSTLLALACVAVLAVGSFAIFTDRKEASVTIKSTADGKSPVDVELVQTWGEKTYVLLPSETLSMPSTINSTGTFAMDVRETFMIESAEHAFDTAAPEFQIYDNTGTVIPVEKRIMPTENGNKVIIYTLDPFVLSGSEEEISGSEALTSNKTYTLKFEATADNTWQGKSVTVTYRLDAKQHTGTNADDWTTIGSITSSIN